jgi:hypothetical protein
MLTPTAVNDAATINQRLFCLREGKNAFRNGPKKGEVKYERIKSTR